MTFTVPDGFQDLLDNPVVVTLATVSAEGVPHTAAVWRRYDGQNILIETGRNSRKHRNILANPRVSLLALDPHNPYRYLEISGMVEFIDNDSAVALAELDRLALIYRGQPRYFGGVVPIERGEGYDGILLKIKPLRAS